MAGRMFEGRIEHQRAEMGRETTEILTFEDRAIWDKESLRLQNEAARKIGFVILDEVIFIHTDETISQ